VATRGRELADANHDEKPESYVMVKILFLLGRRPDDAVLTPGFVLLPHVLHFIGECYQVVPDDHRHCRGRNILKPDQFSGGSLGADREPDLGDQASIAR